ncbi:hypothetical protein ACG2LH_15815 [Zhouia sp. PK063]|uniref:hypothetical protein n=1 Tax=Zhouia sp. PK063 TaxID=3373602 RepID=UPI0037B75AC9
MEDFNLQKFLMNAANNSIKQSLEEYNKHNSQLDKIIVWLVSFSVTAITLTIASSGSKNEFLIHTSDWIIIFSFMVILFGITSRIIFVFFQKNQLDIIFSFDQYVQGYCLPKTTKYTRSISNESTIEDIQIHLKKDFNIDIEVKNPKNDEEYLVELNNVKTLYYSLQEKQLIFEINLFNSNLSRLLGKEIPKIEYSKINSNDTFKEHRVWNYLRWLNYLFIATCVTFVLGILIIMIFYFVYV